MFWHITAYIVSGVFELVMAAYIRSRLRTPTAGPFCLALLLNASWAFGYAVELSLPSLADKMLVFQIRCSPLCFYAPVWLEMVHRMTRGRPLIRGWMAVAVLIVPVVTLALLWFPGPGQNPLLRHSFWVDTTGGFGVLREIHGPWWYVYYLYNYALWTIVFLLLFPRREHSAWERRGRLLFMGAAAIVWTADILHLLKITTPANLNYAPALFPITSSLLAIALLRHHLLNLAPVARAALIERLEDRILVFDGNNRLVDCNRAASATLGIERDPASGRDAQELLRAWPGLAALFDQPKPASIETALGAQVFAATLFDVPGQDGAHPRARVLALNDVTRRKDTENQLRHAKEAAEAGERAQARFLATMSHEIRTPMNGVSGCIQLLKATPLNAEQREHLELIEQSTQSLLAIVNDVLDYSKIEARQIEFEREPCDLRALADQMRRLLLPLASAKQLELTARISPAVPPAVLSDPVRIRQIVTNLLGNAIKFTPSGRVALSVEVPADGMIAFKVADTGIGITAEQQQQIFTPFKQAEASTTRRFGGTGLGLSISRQLCEMMGGSLSLTSSSGRGSVFVARIRAESAPARALPPAKLSEAIAAPSRRLKLLVCEDNAINRKVMAAFLAKLGHDAQFAENGEEGIKCLARREVDVLIMDLEMPVMDGYETTSRIRTREMGGAKRVHIIALTAHAFADVRKRCLACGMDDFLTKPVDFASLADALERAPTAENGSG